jgi:hypothetical protein
MRHFVIAVQGLQPDQERQLADYVAAFGNWWHWIDNLWLLVTSDTDIKTRAIVQKITELNSASNAVVFEFPEDIDWSARLPRDDKSDSVAGGEWLYRYWSRKTSG